ncbi:phosphoribosylglycinamide formyltransferase [Geminocystis sp. NIES-3709]|uniref:phosphoribosylglycinamide formyltransferase n=1 Tax=Geminocystis sp. NIES-3709 TaxID=1617448 RepID=UPI0005FC8202|nr:phosphoribosylglycinamide formyltransferase [Geminocystis sp. NIES-3709]BAQ66599.1 phosphoribosylglycinamide formyltransferase [Geminocystis sp. NIES-3709]
MTNSTYLISPSLTKEQLQLENTVRLGVMASGSGSNFEAIAQAINEGRLNAKIEVLIYNNPNAKVKERADRLNIPTVLLNHKDYKTRKAFDKAIVKVFQTHQVQWVVMAGWMRIITQELLNAYPQKVINIHPSILPSFKGINAVEQSLEAKVKVTGCTVHLVDLEVDSGLILIQAVVPIFPDDTADSLHDRIQIQEHRIIVDGIALAVKKVDS